LYGHIIISRNVAVACSILLKSGARKKNVQVAHILESTASQKQASPLSNIDQTLSGLIRHTVMVN
jgi:hypothetical protein